jgi:F-type H+-transporting ATPase subunit delta
MLENPRTLRRLETGTLAAADLCRNFLKTGEGAGRPNWPEASVVAAGESVEVATENQMTSGVAGRYASALFELAREQGQLDAVDQDLGKFQAMLDQSADMKRMVNSPAFAAEDQDRALKAVMDWASVGATTSNFLRVVARNRRLFAAEDMIKSFRQQLAQHKGEVVAEVQSAMALNDEQLAALKEKLQSTYGKTVRLSTKVDPSLLGGLIVKVGSRMFDSSLKTKLMNLKVVLKGTG